MDDELAATLESELDLTWVFGYGKAHRQKVTDRGYQFA